MEFTFTLIKNHAVDKYVYILEDIEEAGFKIIVQKTLETTPVLRKAFYHEHVDKFYWPNLELSITGLVTTALLYKPDCDCIADYRKFMGATDPTMAELGTLRWAYGDKESGIIARNAVHGSDSVKSFQREFKLFWG